jgi:hypothetical protein
MPSNAGMDSVQQMIDQGLAQIRASLVAFCRNIMHVSTRTADLGALESHATSIDSSVLDSFRGDLTSGAQLTAHARYSDWFYKSFRGTKRSNEDEEYVPPTTNSNEAGSSNDGQRRSVRLRSSK